MAGAASESRFAGLSLMQLHELLEDDAQLGDMVRGMEEVSSMGRGEGGARTARWQPERGPGARIGGSEGPRPARDGNQSLEHCGVWGRERERGLRDWGGSCGGDCG